jgi:plasmid maintenance system antidote protein VapI
MKDTLMYNPPHSGEILKEGYLIFLGLTIPAASDVLGIARKKFICYC